MGFYIRKALRVGNVRFNLSRGGLGLSMGIKGFRLGAGPRGNYVHMGLGGFYFRRSLDSTARHGHVPSHSRCTRRGIGGAPGIEVPLRTIGQLSDVASGPVLEMVDASSAEVLREVNEKLRKPRLLPAAIALSAAGMAVLLGAGVHNWIAALFGALAAGLCWAVSVKDELRKTTVIVYHLEAEAEKAYAALHDAFAALRSCSGVWHVEAQGEVLDSRYHAGARGVIKRKAISLTTGAPRLVKTNVEVPLVSVGKQILAFMPDRLFVFESAAVGAVAYRDLSVEVDEIHIIEDETLPEDAEVVGTTWRYVNKKGGPDRRFKHNPEIPVCLYGRMRLSSPTGLNEIILVSRRDAPSRFQEAVATLQRLSTQQNVAPAG